MSVSHYPSRNLTSLTVSPDRLQRLKDARSEASREIEEYRQAKEADFKSFEALVRHSHTPHEPTSHSETACRSYIQCTGCSRQGNGIKVAGNHRCIRSKQGCCGKETTRPRSTRQTRPPSEPQEGWWHRISMISVAMDSMKCTILHWVLQ